MKPTTHRPDLRSQATPGLLLLALFSFLLSACTMRALVDVNVNEDGSGLFQVSMAFDEELRTLLEEDAPEPIDWTDPASFEGDDSPADLVDEFPEGSEVSPYMEDDFEGFTVAMEFSSLQELDDLLAEMSSEGDEPVPIRVTDDGEGRFELSADGDLFDAARPSRDEMEMLPRSMLEGLFDIQLHVRLPGEIVSTNADETTEDGVMVWELNPLAEEEVLPGAVSQVSTSSFATTLILVAVLVVGAAVAAGVFLRRSFARKAKPLPSGATLRVGSEDQA